MKKKIETKPVISEITDIEYFRENLRRSARVPRKHIENLNEQNISVSDTDIENFYKKLVDGASHMVPRKYLTNTEK